MAELSDHRLIYQRTESIQVRKFVSDADATGK
jgi:hypothetical protein